MWHELSQCRLLIAMNIPKLMRRSMPFSVTDCRDKSETCGTASSMDAAAGGPPHNLDTLAGEVRQFVGFHFLRAQSSSQMFKLWSHDLDRKTEWIWSLTTGFKPLKGAEPTRHPQEGAPPQPQRVGVRQYKSFVEVSHQSIKKLPSWHLSMAVELGCRLRAMRNFPASIPFPFSSLRSILATCLSRPRLGCFGQVQPNLECGWDWDLQILAIDR